MTTALLHTLLTLYLEGFFVWLIKETENRVQKLILCVADSTSLRFSL